MGEVFRELPSGLSLDSLAKVTSLICGLLCLPIILLDSFAFASFRCL